jgi:hypothetical protein
MASIRSGCSAATGNQRIFLGGALKSFIDESWKLGKKEKGQFSR